MLHKIYKEFTDACEIMKPKILIMGGSLRNNLNPKEAKETIYKVENDTDLFQTIEYFCGQKMISNSEGCALAAMYGAKSYADIEYIDLKRYFHKDGSTSNIKELESCLKEADGIIVSSPVYFGDRSSLVQSFFDLIKGKKSLVKGKAFGSLSVGAKRNGGQETTNIYALNDALNCGMIVSGNGPATAQYGGTAWAGDMGSIREDYFGLETCMGTGKKISQVAKILKLGNNKENQKNIRISFWILQDKDGKMLQDINDLISYIDDDTVEFDIINVAKHTFHRCYACPICPARIKEDVEYKCVITKDDMKKLHKRLTSSDAVIFAGYSGNHGEKLESVYQTFLERMRYLRRDRFRLTNKPIAAYVLEEFQTNALFHIRILTSKIRHNTVVHKPLIRTLYKESRLEDDAVETLKSFVEVTKNISQAKDQVDVGSLDYIPVGYKVK